MTRLDTAAIEPTILRAATLRTGATASALICGICAVIAFVFGSPLDFGVTVALGSVFWLVADFLQWQPRAGRHAGPRLPARPGCGDGQPVVLGADDEPAWAEPAAAGAQPRIAVELAA